MVRYLVRPFDLRKNMQSCRLKFFIVNERGFAFCRLSTALYVAEMVALSVDNSKSGTPYRCHWRLYRGERLVQRTKAGLSAISRATAAEHSR